MEVAWHCYVLCPAWQPVSIKQTNWNEYRWQVSILRPSAHKAITISLSDLHKSNDATDDVWKLFHWATPVLMLKFYVACAMTFWRASCHFTASVQLLIFWSTPPKNLLSWDTTGFLQWHSYDFIPATFGVRDATFDHWAMGSYSLRTAWNSWSEMGIVRWKKHWCFWMTPPHSQSSYNGLISPPLFEE